MEICKVTMSELDKSKFHLHQDANFLPTKLAKNKKFVDKWYGKIVSIIYF